MDTNSANHKNRTIMSYDALAGELAEGFDQYFEDYGRMDADFFLSRMNEGATILDVGCGVGTASRYFTERRCTPISADLSQEMLRVCQSRGLSRLVRLDLEELPFLYSTFDGIWAHTSLIHISKERLIETLRAFGKALKVGGALFIAILEGVGENYENRSGEERWFDYFQDGEFEDHVPSGYRILKVNKVEVPNRTFLNFQLVKMGENAQG